MATQEHSLRVGIKGSAAKQGSAEVTKSLADIKKSLEELKKISLDSLKALENANKSAASSVMSLKNALGGLATMQLAKAIYETAASFESLKASLIVSTGSAAGASLAFDKLKEFAKTTPFTLEEATKAYNRLASAGLQPSIEKLRAFGDIASSISGKTIIDFVEAVADGVQGQDKRLKEFGINLVAMGDKMAVNFGKTRVVVENNAQAIEEALIKIATDRFGGAMELQAQTIGGAMSNLSDSFQLFLFSITESGLSEALVSLIRYLSDLMSKGGETAKVIGEVLGGAVVFLTDALKIVIKYWDLVVLAAKALLALGLVFFMQNLVTAVMAAAEAFRVLNVAMASNVIGIIIALLIVLISYFVDLEDLLGMNTEKTQDFRKETEEMIKSLTNIDTNSMEQVLDASESIARAMADTNDQLVTAKDNMGALAERSLLLAAVQKENMKAIVDLIAKMSETKAIAAADQESGFEEDPMDLKTQLAILETKRDTLREAMLKANTVMKDANRVLDGQVYETSTQTDTVVTQGLNVTTTYDTSKKVELDPQKLREYGVEFLKNAGELDNTMKQIDTINAKLTAKEKKATDKASASALKAQQTALESLRMSLHGLETDAIAAQTELELAFEQSDPVELQKWLMYYKEYNRITKDGTIPITEEQNARIKDAVGLIVDARTELEKFNNIQEKRKSIAEELAAAEEALSIEQTVPKNLQNVELRLAELRRELGISKEEAEKFREALERIEAIRQEREKLGEKKKEEETLVPFTERELELLKPYQDFIKENIDLYGQLADFGVQAINKLTDVWVEFTKTGKLNFKDFADFVMAEMTKIIIKFLVASALQAALNAAFPGSAPAMQAMNVAIPNLNAVSGGASAFGQGVGPLISAGVAHSGGLSGSLTNNRWVSGSVFSGATRYHDGGIAGMKPGEVPAILQGGNREAVVPLDNGAIPVEIKGGARSGGDTYNITIVLPGVKNADEFRKSMPQLQRELQQSLNVTKKRG